MDCSHIVLHDALALAALDQAVEMCGPSLNPPLRCLLDCLFVCAQMRTVSLPLPTAAALHGEARGAAAAVECCAHC